MHQAHDKWVTQLPKNATTECICVVRNHNPSTMPAEQERCGRAGIRRMNMNQICRRVPNRANQTRTNGHRSNAAESRHASNPHAINEGFPRPCVIVGHDDRYRAVACLPGSQILYVVFNPTWMRRVILSNMQNRVVSQQRSPESGTCNNVLSRTALSRNDLRRPWSQCSNRERHKLNRMPNRREKDSGVFPVTALL